MLGVSVTVLTDIEDGDRGDMLRGDEGWRTTERSKLDARTLKRSKGVASLRGGLSRAPLRGSLRSALPGRSLTAPLRFADGLVEGLRFARNRSPVSWAWRSRARLAARW